MYDRLINQLIEMEIITGQFMEQGPMAWGGTINNICNAAEEIVNTEVVFVC